MPMPCGALSRYRRVDDPPELEKAIDPSIARTSRRKRQAGDPRSGVP
jgi:hypothetical protein